MAQEPQQYGSYDPRAVRTGRPYDVGYGGYGMMHRLRRAHSLLRRRPTRPEDRSP